MNERLVPGSALASVNDRNWVFEVVGIGQASGIGLTSHRRSNTLGNGWAQKQESGDLKNIASPG